MSGPPVPPPLVAGDTRREYLETDGRAPFLLVCNKRRLMVVASRRPRILCVTDPLGVRSVQDQGGGTPGVRCGEERRHRPAFGDAQQRVIRRLKEARRSRNRER